MAEEDSGSSAMRDLLSDYYGIKPKSPMQKAVPEEGEESGPADIEEMPKVVTEEMKEDLDSVHFDAESFCRKLFRDAPLKQLVEKDNKLKTSVKRLDSDMQMLVYENYNKFITATDMIRHMKDDVGRMEEKMELLLSKMSSISESSTALESKLEPNRARVAKLVGVDQTLKRLQFLFELPSRLKQCIKLGAHAQAVKYYSRANHILQRHGTVPSFQRISQESFQIMRSLKSSLRDQVREGEIVDPSRQMELAVSLVQLGEPPQHLLVDIFTARHTHLKRDLERAQQQCKRQRNKEGEEKEEANEGSMLSLLERFFLDSFTLFAQSFKDTFVGAFEEARQVHLNPQQQDEKMPDPKQALQECLTGLSEFSKDIFQDFFALARRALLTHAELNVTVPDWKKALTPGQRDEDLLKEELNEPPQQAPHVRRRSRSRSKSRDEALMHELMGSKVDVPVEKKTIPEGAVHLTNALAQFNRSLEKPCALVPTAGLLDRSEEIVRHCIRHCIETVFDQILCGLFSALHAVCEAVKETPTMEVRHVAALAPLAKDLIVNALHLLHPIVSTEDYLPVSMALDFRELVHTHCLQLISTFNQVVLLRVPRRSGGFIHSDPGESPLQDLLTTAPPPRCFLLMAEFARALRKVLPEAFRVLDTTFPLPREGQARVRFTEKRKPLLACLDESAQTLLEHYVDVWATGLVEKLRERDCVSDGGGVQPSVRQFVQMVRRVEAELATVFKLDAATMSAASSALPSPRNPFASDRQTKERSLRVGVNRLFAQRVKVFAPVSFSFSSPLFTTLKLAFKGFVEVARTSTLSPAGYTQLFEDVKFVRAQLPETLSAEQTSTLDQMLDEVVSSAVDRCDQPPAFGAQGVGDALSAEDIRAAINVSLRA